ncbi:MAG: DUF4405 domain-containing protein [Candidatus Aenigmatarchaeota archaeon]
MEKEKINYLIDVLMIIALIVVATSGIILYFRDIGFRGESFFWIRRHEIRDVHNYFGFIFIILMITHIVIHFRWIVNMSKKMFKNK